MKLTKESPVTKCADGAESPPGNGPASPPSKRFLGISLRAWGIVGLSVSALGCVWARLLIVCQTLPLPERLHPLSQFLILGAYALLVLWATIALGSPVVSIGSVWSKGLRPHWKPAIVLWIMSWAAFPLARQMEPLKNPGLRRVAQRARPLINAIEFFRADSGRYPSEIEYALFIVKELGGEPYTGAFGYPHFEYQKASRDTPFRSCEIRVPTPSGGINFDCFVYWPEKEYPDHMYGGWVERLGDWAYVHESPIFA